MLTSFLVFLVLGGACTTPAWWVWPAVAAIDFIGYAANHFRIRYAVTRGVAMLTKIAALKMHIAKEQLLSNKGNG